MNNITVEYHKLLEEILKNGKQKGDRTGTGTKSIFSYQIKADMQEGFPLITTKRLHTRSIVHELLWFLQGDTNTKYLNENGVTIWDEWADENGDLGPVYGKQWVQWSTMGKGQMMNGLYSIEENKKMNSINQIQKAIDTLKNNPDSRRILVSAWNVGELDEMALMPCHWSFELYTEELTWEERKEYLSERDRVGYQKEDGTWEGFGYISPFTDKIIHYWLDMRNIPKYRLHLKWHQRSVDTFLGLPFNIASYAMLLHMFAQQTNMIPGTLIGDLTNVHIYDNHISYVEEQITLRDPNKYKLPTLNLNKAESIFDYKFEDFVFENYEYYPNWRNVPIAV